MLALTPRDRRVFSAALRKLAGARVDFAEAMRALREAVEESIADGRIFLLGTVGGEPVLGSLVSGVGLVDGADGVTVVAGRGAVTLGRFA